MEYQIIDNKASHQRLSVRKSGPYSCAKCHIMMMHRVVSDRFELRVIDLPVI